MNANEVTNWDLARLRANASRERAHALQELGAQLKAWLHGPSHGSECECLDAGD
jgi:hypothetical protein